MQQRHGHYLKQIRKGSKLLKCGYGVDMENDGEDQLDSKSQQLRSSESSQGESLYHQHDKSTKTQMAWACSPT